MRARSLMLLLLAAPAAAGAPAKPPLTPDRITPIANAPTPYAAQSVCPVGTIGPAVYLVDYIQPPNDAYYLRARPSACAACAGKPGVWVSHVSVKLEFRVPCTQPVEIAVVSTLGDTACAPPDPPRVMRGPLIKLLTAPSPGTFDFSLPLEGPVALLKDAYLRVTFIQDGVGCTDPGTRPRLVTTSSCVDCVAWNYYPADTTDLCQLLFPGTPIIYANADSCVSQTLAGVGDQPATSGLRVAPDPARSDGEVRFALAQPGRVRLTVCDVAGRRVRTLLDAALPAGERAITWDGRDDAGARVRPGAYFAVMDQGDRMTTRRILLLGAR